jgi:hypothetical protein
MGKDQPFPQGDFDHDKCQHRTEVVLAGRRVCTEGCGRDLGPA